jgi:site-specific DNA-methyltransferase (adenine-specific)
MIEQVLNNIKTSFIYKLIDDNLLINDDCLKVMPLIPNNSIDLILADLPYSITASKWDKMIPLDQLWEQYKRIIKNTGVIVLTSTQPFTTKLIMSNIEMFKYEWIWSKNTSAGFIHAKNKPLRRHENILVFSKASIGHASLLGDKRMKYNPQNLIEQKAIRKNGVSGNIIGFRPSHHDNLVSEFTNYPISILNYKNDKGLHPTQKPVALFEYLIKTYTDENDLVLDNVMGSGTTGIACKNTNRRFIGIEKETKYFEIAYKRYNLLK